jgi:deazaflavin-dependent oxidoreductase (nitroreductase family)
MTAISIGAVGGRILRSRRLMRAPIWAFRAGLGFVFGSRLLLLEHVGRRSGQPRYVVVEVVGQPAPNSYAVVSGFGTRAQWFRNVRANPRVRVAVGRRRLTPASARLLPATEGAALLQAYTSAHPRAWRALAPVLANTFGAPIDPATANVPMVEFRLLPR